MTVVGHYELLEKLGEGGMGQVFKARDTLLDRTVAVKLLPPDKAEDAGLRARFLREARAASALNHPHIVTVFDVLTDNGNDYIVLEYLPGETLAAQIAHKQISPAKALKMAAQIADGLACAHAHGIVHRDLKPANIMVSPAGAVKILDFGLAKRAATVHSDRDETFTMRQTGENCVVGTFAYMSPEQVSGREVDHRTDIFSFGLVLHELLTGSHPFPGLSSLEVMASILKEEPANLPESIPPGLREIVTCCLEKDPAARFQSAHDLGFALRNVAFSSGAGTSQLTSNVDARDPTWDWRKAGLAIGLAAMSVLALWAYASRPQTLDLSKIRFRPVAMDAEPERFGTWSPDGKSVAYLKEVEGRMQLMVRSLQAPTARMLTHLPAGVFEFSAPFFSPDGGRIYYIAGEALWSVGSVGGEPVEVQKAPMLAAALSPDGKTLVFWRAYLEQGKEYGGLWFSSPPGATPRRYEPAPFRTMQWWIPVVLKFSPDGAGLVYAGSRAPGEGWAWFIPSPGLTGSKPRQLFANRLLQQGVSVDWMPDSRHLCLSDGRLSLADSLSAQVHPLIVSAIGQSSEPSVSPGGDRILFTTHNSDLDLIEIPLDDSPPRTLLATSGNELSPSWSASGDSMAFISDRSGDTEIWLRSAKGDWERPIVRQSDFPDDPGYGFQAASLSPDGSLVAYRRHGKEWVSPVTGGSPAQLSPGTQRESGTPSWSPDGASVTYLCSTGQTWELAVSKVGSHVPPTIIPQTVNLCVSAPVWSPDGRWIACGGHGQSLELVSPDGKRRRKAVSPVPADMTNFVLIWTRDSRSLLLASSTTPVSRLDKVDLEANSSRNLAMYQSRLRFRSGFTYMTAGSLSADGKSIATTVLNRREDLWIMEGVPRLPRPWF